MKREFDRIERSLVIPLLLLLFFVLILLPFDVYALWMCCIDSRVGAQVKEVSDAP
jgi:hypothetical protein